MADAWSHAAKTLISTLGALAQCRGRTADTRLIDLLGAALSGNHSCVTAEGQISIPGWAELRRHKRHIVDFNIELVIAGSRIAARAENASASGLGLSVLDANDARLLVPGGSVAVALPDREAISGKIAWVAGARAGIALDQSFDFKTTLDAIHR